MDDVIDLDLVQLSETDIDVLAACCEAEREVILQLRTRKRLLGFIRAHSARELGICVELRVMREVFLPQVVYRIEHGCEPPNGWVENHFGSV